MRWFEAEPPMAETPRRVKFAQVPTTSRRAPSWLPKPQSTTRALPAPPNRRDTPSLKPPPLPSEFVDAMRQELGDMPSLERSRSVRPSEGLVPPRSPTVPPPALAASVQSALEAVSPVLPEPEPPVPFADPELTLAFEQAVELLAHERQRVFEQTASQLAELAAVIARRVIARELTLHPDVVCDLVREGLEALSRYDRVSVRLGVGFETQQKELERRLSERGATCEVRVDPTLPEHGCFIETELGQVDESVESRLATLLHALRPDGATE